ncbi:MAG: hypothetical protein KDC53_02170 [Saprospiraceae bacterium]|nr:hypothetical protein [Saprospiraceae bacterium]
MQDRRQLRAIMFTDIVGYTSVMQLEESRAISLRKRYKQVIEELHEAFDGEIIQFLGDGSLSIFESSVQAVRCAMGLQNEFGRMPTVPVRIGIHTGDIIRSGKEIIGDSVNIAARLEGLGEAGSIMLSNQVHYHIKNQNIKTKSLGLIELKNVLQPMEVFAVIASGLLISDPSLKTPGDDLRGLSGTKVDPEKKSIAILPFVNMSHDPEQEYFCDGITEEIINSVCHVNNLRVIARTSVFAFKNKNEDVREIGKKLNVNSILEGSVRKSGNRLRIMAQLIDATDGSHLWSERYERELNDVFKIQDEISMAIVDQLKVRLFSQEKAKLLQHTTENVGAYNYYLRGQYEWYKRNREGLFKSIELYKLALQEDHQYVLAYTGIANAYNALNDWGELDARQCIEKARDMLSIALEINAQSAELYSAFAYLSMCDWDRDNFVKNYQLVLKYNAHQPFIFHIDSIFLCVLGDFENAINQNTIARQHDPLNLVFNFSYGVILYFKQDMDLAIRQYNYLLSLSSIFKPAYLFLMYCYLASERFEEAVETFAKMIDVSTGSSVREGATLRNILEKEGWKKSIQWIIDYGLDFYGHYLNKPYHQAVCYATLENHTQVFENLEMLYNIRSFRLTFLYADPLLMKYRKDPRFIKIVHDIGLWK